MLYKHATGKNHFNCGKKYNLSYVILIRNVLINQYPYTDPKKNNHTYYAMCITTLIVVTIIN